VTVRELCYPNYDVEAYEGGDIRLRFFAPGSRFGPVHVVLAADDASLLLELIDKALTKSESEEAA
jgi:hypothetical protein